MEEMTGEDLITTLMDTKESASGLDQWKPVEFKMLPTLALERLVDMMNIIEEGAE